jgi:hypothetical protein
MGVNESLAYSRNKLNHASRYDHIKGSVDEIMIGGYVLEFGVGGGNSLNYIAGLTDRRIFGFDSFEGLPENWSPNSQIIFAKGSFKYDPPENVQDNVELVTGWFEDTIPVWKEVNFGPIAFLHIDSDLYSSCVTILTELNDQIKPGTIILFDELISYLNWEEGEWKALQEWMSEYDREVFELGSYKTQVTYRVIK